jgi:hypothetical protein
MQLLLCLFFVERKNNMDAEVIPCRTTPTKILLRITVHKLAIRGQQTK